MSHFFQLLRGTGAEWEAHNVPLKDGEPALLKKEDGRVELRVGNGTDNFSDLKPVGGGRVVTDAVPFGELEAGTEYRLGSADCVEYSFPGTVPDDFYAILTFDSGAEAAVLLIDEDCYFTGDDTANGVFTPLANKHYTLLLFYDGTKQGLVRGVPHA